MTPVLKPMLASHRDPQDMVALAHDEAWAFQLKQNGDRVMLSVTDGKATVIGRDGQHSQHNGHFRLLPYSAPLAGLPDCVLDGELLDDGAVWLFDLVHLESEWADITPADEFARRCEVLADLFRRHNLGSTGRFHLASTAIGTEAKLELALACIRDQEEGVIARRLDGVYSLGRRSTAILKLKFVFDADLVVDSVGFEGRDNVVLIAYDENGTGIPVGRASAHGKGSFAKGDVVVVRYNYLSRKPTKDCPFGRLVGPRIMGRRTDKPALSCTTEQLIYSDQEPVYEH